MAAFRTTPWRLISGILAVICLLLMAALGLLLKNLFPKQSIGPISSPGATEPPEGSDCCSCQEKWIGYRCNCYFISNGKETWTESRDFCASQNSSLLHLQNEDELSFMNHSINFYWIGLSYNEEQGVWQWEDGSALSPDLFSLSQTVNIQNCITYRASGSTLDKACESKSRYICKKKLIGAYLGVS
ncbi:natural killer cells antigen CD94 [Rhinolophus ferrumequinum]|uniref:natural killer cells antigen CD94 n=1 Tax=Rhinolophus ferrumequinum TaxID=59479 RepID=UPI00140F56FE|nr:natural killer cells antigen CD94 [Rhinolophus ferrumequinum]